MPLRDISTPFVALSILVYPASTTAEWDIFGAISTGSHLATGTSLGPFGRIRETLKKSPPTRYEHFSPSDIVIHPFPVASMSHPPITRTQEDGSSAMGSTEWAHWNDPWPTATSYFQGLAERKARPRHRQPALWIKLLTARQLQGYHEGVSDTIYL